MVYLYKDPKGETILDPSIFEGAMNLTEAINEIADLKLYVLQLEKQLRKVRTRVRMCTHNVTLPTHSHTNPICTAVVDLA